MNRETEPLWDHGQVIPLLWTLLSLMLKERERKKREKREKKIMEQNVFEDYMSQEMMNLCEEKHIVLNQ